MQQSNQETYTYQVEEFDLRKLAKSLKERRWFIFGFTGIATLLAILYTLSLPPLPYEIKAGFLKPDKTSLHEINKSKLLESFITTDFTDTTEERLHSSFLKNNMYLHLVC